MKERIAYLERMHFGSKCYKFKVLPQEGLKSEKRSLSPYIMVNFVLKL